MDKNTAKKMRDFESAAASSEGMEQYWKNMEVKLATEIKAMEGISHEELIKYAALNRMCIVEMQSQVSIYAEALQVHQKQIDLLAFVVNELMDKKEVGKLDLSKLVVKGNFQA